MNRLLRPRIWACNRTTVPRYRGIAPEAHLDGTPQGRTSEDGRKDAHLRDLVTAIHATFGLGDFG